MSKYKVTATKTTTGMQVSAGTRGFEITFDEPESTNTGMNPVEILLASFGACQAITAQALAKKRNFDLRAFWVTIEGDLGREDVADGKNVRKFTEIRYQPHLRSSESASEEYGVNVETSIYVNETDLKDVKEKLINRFNDQLQITEGDQRFNEIPY